MKTHTVGRCIYCGRTEPPLGREHIIPLGLNGNLVLQAASCSDCARITGQVEQDALRNAFLGPRVAFGMRTRRPKKRCQLLPLQVETAGKRHIIQVPLEDYPVYIALPLFEPPAHISMKPYVSGIGIRAAAPVHLAGPTFPEVQTKYRFDYVGIRLEYQPVLFARMLAKIGLGMTVFALGPDAIGENYVLPDIVGDGQSIGRWVGSEDVAPVNPTSGLHAVSIGVHNREVHARIRLFAQFHQAEYLVVVGRLRDGVVLERAVESAS